MKLSKIKEELAKLLIKMSLLKTDKAVLEYEGEELVAGMPVYITDEEEERVPAEDGEYVTEDNKVITVANGRVESIVEPTEEPATEEDTEEIAEEEVVAEEVETVEEPTIEEEETVVEEEPKEIDELKERIKKLEELVESLMTKLEDKFSAFEKMSAARPASEEFEAINKSVNTGDKNLDNLIKALKK